MSDEAEVTDADLLAREETVLEALVAAEKAANEAGESTLALCIARLRGLWAIGAVVAVQAALDAALVTVRQALRDHVGSTFCD